MTRHPRKLGRPPIPAHVYQARYAALLALYRLPGVPLSEIGRRFNLSKQRIHQIAVRAGEQPRQQPRGADADS